MFFESLRYVHWQNKIDKNDRYTWQWRLWSERSRNDEADNEPVSVDPYPAK